MEPAPSFVFPSYDESGMIFAASQDAYHQGVGAPVALVVRVVGLSEYHLYEDRPCQSLRMRDIGETTSILTMPVADLPLLQRAQALVKSGAHAIAYGAFLPAQDSRSDDGPTFRFQLQSLHTCFRPSALLGASPGERQCTLALIDQLVAAGPSAIVKHVLSAFHQSFGIASEQLSDRFRTLEKLVVLQALSHGQVEATTNHRLSTYFISAPGQSKKCLSLLAETLAPVSYTIQPTSVSMAGATVRIEQRPRIGWTAQAGALPLSNGGACVMEDIHRLPRKIANAIEGSLMSTAEDGQVNPMKAVLANYEARCALHLNGNRHSVVDSLRCGKGAHTRLSDASLSADLFSRLDIVAEVDTDDDPAASSIEIVKKRPAPSSEQEQQQQEQNRRELKLLIACLLDRFPAVDTSQVEHELGRLQEDLIAVLREVSARQDGQQVFDTDGLLKRMANTVRKLVGASARLCGRGVATVADVECAWQMLSFKLEMVRWACSEAEHVQVLGSRPEVMGRVRRAQEQRWQQVLLRFGGQVVTMAQVAEALQVTRKQAQREVEARGVRPMEGLYSIPTPEQYERQQEELERLRERGQQPVPLPRVRPEDRHLHEADVALLGLPHEFHDVLPRVPSAVRSWVRGLDLIEDPDHRQMAAATLARVALEEHIEYAEYELMLSELFPEGYEWEPGAAEEWKKRVLDPEWSRRGLFVLSVLAESNLPVQDWRFRLALEQDGKRQQSHYPEKLRAGMRALMARAAYFREQAHRLRVIREIGILDSG